MASRLTGRCQLIHNRRLVSATTTSRCTCQCRYRWRKSVAGTVVIRGLMPMEGWVSEARRNRQTAEEGLKRMTRGSRFTKCSRVIPVTMGRSDTFTQPMGPAKTTSWLGINVLPWEWQLHLVSVGPVHMTPRYEDCARLIQNMSDQST